MNEVRKVVFVINRFAGTGYSSKLEDKIIQTSRKNNVEAILEFTKGPGHAIELAKASVDSNAEKVVAVGGDGTINEVARGLAGTGIPMAIIPRGSGNGLARHLYIPLTIQQAIDNVFSGALLAMDTFTLNGKLSLNVSGIGFDGRIAQLFGGKTKRGLTGYATLTIREFLRFKEFDSVISSEGLTWKTRSFVLAIANSSQYGNDACIAPGASVTDGLLNLNILRKIPPYRFDFVYAFFTKTIDRSPYCNIKTLSNFTIETSEPIPYHVDGEPCGLDQRFEVILSPAALPVIVPNKTIAAQSL
jgi:diacylglycerol kinase (ATP)